MFEKLKKKFESIVEQAQKRHAESADVSRFNHPLAEQTDWHPLKRGGSNFCTHRLDATKGDLLVFKATKGAKFFIGLFGFFGLLGLIIPLTIFFSEDGEWFLLLFALLFGGIFTGVSFLLFYFMTMPRVFDRFYGHYYQGRKKPDEMKPNPKRPLINCNDIVALQLIREYVRSDKSSYHSYELNLVLRDGKRINVVDHGKIDALREDAEILSTYLSVPVWDAA